MTTVPTPQQLLQSVSKADQLTYDVLLMRIVDHLKKDYHQMGDRVVVHYEKTTSQKVMRLLKERLEESGWELRLCDGQLEMNIDSTYSMVITRK